MATMASKLKTAKEVIVKKGKEQFSIFNSELAETIEALHGLAKDIKAVEPLLKEYKAYIAKEAKNYIDTSATITFIVKGISCKVTFQYEAIIPQEYIEEVKKILGSRFDDLVRIKTTYMATQKLIELATDADNGAELAKYIVVKEKAPQISFK